VFDRIYDEAYFALKGARLALRDWRHRRSYADGQTIPPPHVVKARTVIDTARRLDLDTFVETGTYLGEMVWKTRRHFRQIYSIEVDDALALRAAAEFRRCRNVTVLQGDSATVLPGVLSRLDHPALLWLDAHFSPGLAARGVRETALADELQVLEREGMRGHVVLIDDARHLGTGPFPSLAAVRSAMARIDPSYEVSVAEDIVRCIPGR